MLKIKQITAREILDSRGDPTIEATVLTTDGCQGSAAVPSGASTGAHEAWELRDGDKKRYGGKGVLKAVSNVEKIIAPALIGIAVTKQEKIDQIMMALDGTNNKVKLGANAILAVSLASARAAAAAKSTPLYRYLGQGCLLPMPLVNIFNGGKHASTNLDFQELKIVPLGADSLRQAVEMSATVFHQLGELLVEEGLDTDIGNEGGYAPELKSTKQALDLLMAAISKAGYKPGAQVSLAIDAGASSFYNPQTKKYQIKLEGANLTAAELIDLYQQWLRQYPLVSIEDGLAEDDWANWAKLNAALGARVQIMGDDLTVTNTARLQKAITEKAGNAVLIKPNQIGTLTETLATINLAKRANWRTIVSHRSGETCDSFIADLAVGVAAGQIKTGSMSRGERTAKYNRLLYIEEQLGAKARFSQPFAK